MTVNKAIDQAIISLGYDPTVFSASEKKVIYDEIRDMVNKMIDDINAGVSDKIIELDADNYTYDIGDDVQRIKSVVLNDSIEITDCQVSPERIVTG